MSINKIPIAYLFLFLFIVIVNNAYGFYATSAGQTSPTREWKVVSNSTRNFTSNNGLSAIVATSVKSIWAVGYAYADEGTNSRVGAKLTATGLPALIERWDGSTWQSSSSPKIPGATYVALSSIVALSNQNIWAVGGSFTSDYSRMQQLIEHWDGRSWHIVRSPFVKGAVYTNLFGITALAANDIWVVGGYARAEDNGLHHALVEHWNGASWSIVPTPRPAPSPQSVYEELQSTVAITQKDIWAVGVSLTSSYSQRSLIEHWDGTSWRMVASNDLLASSRSNRSLNALAARSSSDIWAVGRADDRGPVQSLIKHWNGKTWSTIPGPGSTPTKLVADGGNLLGLAILSTNDIWAVGSVGSEPRIEHWNGKVWSIVTSPLLSAGTSTLSGIAHVADAHQLWAVGSTNQHGLSEIRSDVF